MGQQDRFSREYYPALGPSWDSRGIQPESSQYGEQYIAERTGAPPSIQKALRDYAGLPLKYYFMVGIMENGGHASFCTPGCMPVEKVEELAATVRSNFCPVETSEEPQIPFRRSTLDGDEDYPSARGSRKRRADFAGDDARSALTTKKKRAIVISDSKQLWQFYEQRFKNCQQAACKLIAKAWIKTVEPKKQSTHPYTGKDEKAPDWWPQPWGDGHEQRVRHKEPDHLYKRERLHLLGHILKLVVEPNGRQHPDIKKLQLNVAKLEEVTWEALSGWFADSSSTNGQKKAYLKEIFTVAKQEERFKDGAIDATTKVHVMPDDRILDGYASDGEDNSPFRPEDGQDCPSISRSVTPHKGLSQDMTTYDNAHGSIDNPGDSLQATYMNSTGMRASHYNQNIAGSDFHEDVTRYGEVPVLPTATSLHQANGIGYSGIGYMPPHDPDRRASVADAHSEYATPTTASSYDPWSSTSGPSASSVYAMPGSAYSSAAPVPIGQSASAMTQPHHYPIIYDGMPRSHDLASAAAYRNFGPMPSPTAYSDFGHQQGRGHASSSIKQEGYNRPLN